METKLSPRVYIEKVLERGSYEHLQLVLLNLGSLAPSTHNTQPWLLEYDKNSVTVWPDFEKQVPHADPHNKYLFISLGAFIGNIVDFLQSMKVTIEVSHNEETQATTVEFTHPKTNKISKESRDSMNRILNRQNYRGFYKPATKDSIKSINNITSTFKGLLAVSEPSMIKELANETAKGVETAYGNKYFRQEIAALINHNRSKKRVGLHGYSLRLKQVQSLIVPRVMRYKDIGKKLGDLNKKSFETSHVVCLFVLAKNSDNPNGWIDVGIKLEDIQLRLYDAGFACSIYVASLENEKTKSKVKSVFSTKAKTPAILFTVGAAPDRLPHSVRQLVSEKMKS